MERRIVAIMAADMVGYSRMMEADETGTLARQKRLMQDVIGPVLANGNGRIVKKMGDGLLVEFASPVEAVQSALALQAALKDANDPLPDDQRQIMRIGINLGDVIVEEGDLFGDGVNIAARLEQMAPPGGIVISGTIHDHLKSNIDAPFVPMGEATVKNISQPVRTYHYAPDGVVIPRSARRRRPVLRRVFMAFAVLIAALFGFFWFAEPPPPPGGDGLSIAVLPFQNGSGDPDQAYFAIGISEDINTDLSKVEGLSVLPPSAAYRFGENNTSAAWVGQALGVDYTLDGSLRRAGDQIRLTVRLTDVQTQTQIWAERYDRTIDDVFAIQDEIAQQVVRELPATLALGQRSYRPNVEAYDAYIRSRAQRIPPTPRNLAAARSSAEKAVQLDPNFAGGHAALASVTLLEAEALGDPAQRERMNAQAQALAEKAIQLDDTFGPAWGSLAEAHFRAGRFDAALEAARKAVALSSTDSLMRGQLGRYLSYAGAPEEGITHIRAALAMSPDSLPLLFFLGAAQYAAGEVQAAVESLSEHRVRLNERVLPAPTVLLIASLAEAGQIDRAKEEVDKLRTAAPGYGLVQALVYHSFNDPVQSERLSNALVQAGMR